MSVPTEGECYSKMSHHLSIAHDEILKLHHIAKANEKDKRAKQWWQVHELFEQLEKQLRHLAMGRMQ